MNEPAKAEEALIGKLLNAPTKQDYALAREILGPYVVATSAEIHRAAVRIAAHTRAACANLSAEILELGKDKETLTCALEYAKKDLAQTKLERDCEADAVTRLSGRAKKRKT